MPSKAALLATLSVLLLSGCTASQTLITSSPPEPAQPTYAFAPATTPSDHPDGFGSEPSLLAVGNALYFTSVLGSATARGDGVWTSTDNGTTWKYLGKVDFPFGGGDSDIDAVPGSGRLLVTGQWRPAAPPSLPVVGSPYVTGGESIFTSDDGGATWAAHPTAGYLPAADRQWILPAPDGKTVYLAFNDAATGLNVGTSPDAGTTWLPPVVVPGTGSAGGVAAGPNGIAGDGVVGPDGTLYVPYGVAIGGGSEERLIRSTDGRTFDTQTIHKTPSGEQAGAIFSAIAMDAAGTLHAAWAETHAKGMRILYASSKDKGVTWTPAVQVTPDSVTTAFPWIVAGGAGKVAIAYLATVGSTLPDNADPNATWVPVVSFLDGQGNATGVPTFTSVAATSTPNHVGPICTQGTGCTGGRKLGDFFEAAVTPDGRVVLVYADDTGAEQSNHVSIQSDGPRLR